MNRLTVSAIALLASTQLLAADFALECSSRDDGMTQATFVALNKTQAILTFHYNPKIERLEMSKTQEMPDMYVFQVTKSNSDWGKDTWYLKRDSLVLKGNYLGAQPFRCRKLNNPDQANQEMNKLYADYVKKSNEQERRETQTQLKRNQI